MKYKLPRIQHEVIRLRGGLDLITPTLDLKPGVLRDSVNWEVSTTGGYTRIAGYERFDGRPNPSNAIFATIVLTALGTIAVGDTINGATSGATGVVIVVDTATNAVTFTKATGTFQVGENCRKGAVVQGVVTALSSVNLDPKTTAQYLVLAANHYRSDILAVPGSGPVRGVAYFNGVLYAWRDNAGGTALVMHKATAGGWSAIDLGVALNFVTGSGQITDGQTVTGATSGATGVVTRAVLRSGVWGSTAAGTLVFASTTGTFTNGENLQVGGITKAVASGGSAAQTLLPGGRVDTDIGALSGGASGAKLYGADGVNNGFEYDGTSYVKIVTGMTADTPTRAKVHRNSLFLTFAASLQHSSLGLPYEWSVVTGAGEIAMGGTITALSVLPGSQDGGALAVYSRNSTATLYGSSSADWNLVHYNSNVGAIMYTEQVLSSSYVLDDRGVLEFSTSQNYGNFSDATLTNNIRPFVQSRRNLAKASVVNREKSQYRVFFSDGYGLYLTISNGKLLGCMPVLFPISVTCAVSGETPDGAETAFIGASDGFVYRLDSGPNFDGAAISATMFFNYNPSGDSRVLKHYRRGSLEITGSSYAEISVGYDLAYSRSTVVDQQAGALYMNSFVAPFWDSFIWDNFVWDGLSLGPTDIEITGTAENIALRIDSNTNYSNPFTINSMILHYNQRRELR